MPLLLLMLAAVLAAVDELPDINLRPAFAGARFDRPLWVAQLPDDGRFLVLEQAGLAKLVDADGRVDTVLDLTRTIRLPGGYTEEGLLSAAFHPQFADNRQILLWYTTRRSGRLQTVLARHRFAAGGPVDPNGESLLVIDQPFGNHNGGDLHFGADGMLYLAVGDGGSGGDPQNHGQRLDTLLGTVLRLDVDGRDGALAYRVPPDNPFVGQPGARPEIWAYGLRNVWRMAFDPVTGDLWAGDVGQNAREEITRIVRGGNHGWRLREGTAPFKGGEREPGMIEPVWDYPHSQGRSVTGGFVYRGKAIPSLVGAYVFADWVSRRMWALRERPGAAPLVRQIATAPGQPASFGIDRAGELYVCSFDGLVYVVGAP